MSDPYIGEIRIFAGNFAPRYWMFCNGATLPISENEALFQLIGTTYGGDGQETFNLPNLQGRVPIHFGSSGGQSYQLAEMGGAESVTLTTQQMPAHTHALRAAGGGATLAPTNATLATVQSAQGGARAYGAATPGIALGAQSILPSGGSQPHDNTQPSLGLNFIISLIGLFPSQT